MGQVPNYLIIGDGRLGKHFQHYLHLLGLPFLSWSRRSLHPLRELIPQASHILILINDQVIEPFIEEQLRESKALLIHCSGSLVTPLAYGAHPLFTFSKHTYDLETYQKIPFILDEGAPSFATLFPHFSNPHAYLSTDLKAKYHALCVMGANFSCLLWQKLFSSFTQEFGLPGTFAQPLLWQQMQNLISSPQSALTGPLVRKDDKTIEKNLAALRGDPYRSVYESFIECFKQINT